LDVPFKLAEGKDMKPVPNLLSNEVLMDSDLENCQEHGWQSHEAEARAGADIQGKRNKGTDNLGIPQMNTIKKIQDLPIIATPAGPAIAMDVQF